MGDAFQVEIKFCILWNLDAFFLFVTTIIIRKKFWSGQCMCTCIKLFIIFIPWHKIFRDCWPFRQIKRSFRTSYVAHGRDQKKHQISWENYPLLAEPALSQIDNMGVFMIFIWEFIQKNKPDHKNLLCCVLLFEVWWCQQYQWVVFLPACKHYLGKRNTWQSLKC